MRADSLPVPFSAPNSLLLKNSFLSYIKKEFFQAYRVKENKKRNIIALPMAVNKEYQPISNSWTPEEKKVITFMKGLTPGPSSLSACLL